MSFTTDTPSIVEATGLEAPATVDSIIDGTSTSTVAKSIPADVAAAITAGIQSPEGQGIEAEVISGLPKWARGTIYAGIGAASTAAGSILGFALQYPGVVPGWLVATATVAAGPLSAIVASSAFSNLGKK
jgi:hypothetical protein